MAKKIRADVALFEQGLAESPEKAERLIMAGQVYLVENGQHSPIAKPGQQVGVEAELAVKGVSRFVSRGGEKLLTAIEELGLDPSGKVCLDAGASTGGFTDCMLQHGAARVYAVDVGRAQLHEKLRVDPRVVSMEQVNLRLAPPDLLPEPVDLIVADVSFISLTKVLPPCLAFLKPSGEIVALIKPQFELEAHEVGKGVVRDEALRQKAVDKIVDFCRETLDLALVAVVPSKITGPKGNQEYLAYFRRAPA